MDMNDILTKYAGMYDVEEEKKLIQRVQSNPNDGQAWQLLKIKFKGIINNAISSAAVKSPLVPQDIIEPQLMEKFEEAILSYDATRNTRPSTHISNHIYWGAKKIDSNNTSYNKVLTSLGEKVPIVNLARQYGRSSFDREPTAKETHQILTDVYKKSYPFRDIKKIMDLERNVFSADRIIGSDGEAETMTLGETLNVTDATADDVMNEQAAEKDLTNALSKLSPEDKRLFEQYMGLGQWKNNPQKSFTVLGINNHMTYYKVKNRIEDIQKRLRKELNSAAD